MADTAGTQDAGATAQDVAAGEATTPDAPAGTTTPDRVSVLESRLSGLEARLTESGRAKSQAEKDRDAALQKLADYESGKLKDNEAFQAELQRERERATAAERSARLAAIEVRYPETYGVFGEAAAGFSEEQLVASEARYTGSAVAQAPTPRNPSTTRPSAPTGEPAPEATLAELRQQFRQMSLPTIDD
jgi:hypothetical protein